MVAVLLGAVGVRGKHSLEGAFHMDGGGGGGATDDGYELLLMANDAVDGCFWIMLLLLAALLFQRRTGVVPPRLWALSLLLWRANLRTVPGQIKSSLLVSSRSRLLVRSLLRS